MAHENESESESEIEIDDAKQLEAGWAWYGFARPMPLVCFLTLCNLINYLDRGVTAVRLEHLASLQNVGVSAQNINVSRARYQQSRRNTN